MRHICTKTLFNIYQKLIFNWTSYTFYLLNLALTYQASQGTKRQPVKVGPSSAPHSWYPWKPPGWGEKNSTDSPDIWNFRRTGREKEPHLISGTTLRKAWIVLGILTQVGKQAPCWWWLERGRLNNLSELTPLVNEGKEETQRFFLQQTIYPSLFSYSHNSII